MELVNDFVGKDVVSAQLVISPDNGISTKPLTQEGIKGQMETADPATLVGGKRLVINMGITDEDVLVKSMHIESPSRNAGTKCRTWP
jgi:hypothetical protein